MHPLLFLSTLLLSLLSLFSLSRATALTYKLAPSEKACFFTWVEQKNAKVAFYFAVGIHFATSHPASWCCLTASDPHGRLPITRRNPRANLGFMGLSRSNPAAPSKSIIRSRAQMTRSSWLRRKSGKGTLSSRRKRWESIGCALTMR